MAMPPLGASTTWAHTPVHESNKKRSIYFISINLTSKITKILPVFTAGSKITAFI
jgi:hypothetical protein